MEYRVREELHRKKGVISNTHGFLSTYLDGGFREKWSGYWSPSHKYLDYFGVKVNGIWLNAENLEETVYGDKIVYRHQASSLEIVEEVKTPENLPGFKIEWNIKNRSEDLKAVKISVEPGVDIRPKTEDIGDNDYSIETSKAGMKISSGSKWISVSGKSFEFEEDSYIKEHFPGERQKCLVPGEISFRQEVEAEESLQTELVFKTDEKGFEPVKTSKSSLRHNKIGRTFNYSLKSLENLFYSKNRGGVIAGHPWFQNYWARDSFWTVLGMIDAGMFEEAEIVLKNFGERDNFPSKILTDGGTESDYPRADSIPLFAIAVDRLDRFYGCSSLKDRADKLLAEKRPRGKLVNHDPKGTWMDTLKRGQSVEIQSLWIEALERFGRGTQRLRKGLEEFKEDSFLKDNLENNFESINPAVTLMFSQLESSHAEKSLEKVNGEFSSRFGARTRSVTDPGYDPSGYHTGSTWGLTTCWAAAANLAYGKTSHGINYLEKLSQFLDRNQLGALPELVDSESGESLGCDEQAWSAGMFVHVVDSYLLGINAEDGRMIVDPVDGVSCTRRSKKVQGETVDLKFNNGEAEVLNNPDIEVEIR